MSMHYSKDKTKELIDELKGKGHISSMEDLSKFIQKTGLVVSETVGRRRSHIEVNPKVYGVNLTDKNEETQKFFADHVKLGKINFIPDTLDKELGNAESSVRTARRRACIGFDDKYMPIETYKTFLRKFEEHKKRYFETRDRIVVQWESLMKQFEKSLRASLDDLNAVDQEIVVTSILAKIPSREEYKESFYMDLEVKPFPVMENLDMFEDDIKETIAQGMQGESVTTMYEIIASCLNDGFQQVSAVLSTIERGNSVTQKSKTALQDAAKRIKQKNILSNDRVNGIAAQMDKTSRISDQDEIAERAESIASQIIGYAEELSIGTKISTTNSSLTYEELLEIYEMEYEEKESA
ncbi:MULTISPECIES: hypothetical protein [unclassified Psychrobacillus]|uniref:hypothetical protein n=1 Tax=unclassified Psychrobacillus TaxID=2636677 RepID=UPI0030F51E80